ncbi:FadR/GntR family transcriptional regulator [Pseudogracilibacillus sp. SO10305]|uniref:FadR/GntR family transcriptional regulator n=1 Tax=Pseudogracilibacillus sp. SO10305 TaxID=3098292 RepID=UPI00300DEB90
MIGEKRLSDKIATEILSMITVDQRFVPGDQLPNELEFSEELKISRTTLREAIRILVTNGILEIKRGRGTFVKEQLNVDQLTSSLHDLSNLTMNIKDLYEIRLIFEPEAAYYATLRATDQEIAQILQYGKLIEEKINKGEDRTEVEQLFHRTIAQATHNEFIDRLMPVIFQAINKGVILSEKKTNVVTDTIHDHRLIMEFMEVRNAEGARNAMKIHILHAMKDLGMT